MNINNNVLPGTATLVLSDGRSIIDHLKPARIQGEEERSYKKALEEELRGKPFLKVKELAPILRCSERTIYNAVRRKAIPKCQDFPRAIRIPTDWVLNNSYGWRVEQGC